MMSIEILKQIREHEARADKIRRDGLTESKRIVNAATAEAAVFIDGARAEAHDSYRKALQKADEEARIDHERIIHHAQWECHMLLAKAEKKLDKAVSVIIDKVLD